LPIIMDLIIAARGGGIKAERESGPVVHGSAVEGARVWG
jgi:hypothetical protein